MKAVMTFYRFVAIDDPEALRKDLYQRCQAAGLKGTILLAEEGINGTLSGEQTALTALAAELQQDPRFADMACKYSAASPENPVFFRLKVKVRPEIVALGQPAVRPAERTGVHVDAATWNALLADPEVVVIDTRNQYEIGVGTFPAAVDPGTKSFREFPDFVQRELDPARHPKVAMFCTGGIRCEKASAYMLAAGFAEVYQLDGGILKYLETVPANENQWQGECFVFDQRVTVTAALAEGDYVQCHACRSPLSLADQQSALYQEGLSCPHCHDQLSSTQRAALAERQRQMALAAARGELHVGARMPERPPRQSRVQVRND